MRLAGRPPNQGPQPGPQLGKLEWLDEVIVGTAVEPADAVGNAVLRGQHQDRHRLHAPEPFQKRPTIQLGQHNIEDNCIVIPTGGLEQTLIAVFGRVDGISLLAQRAGDDKQQIGIVLDNQYSHCSLIVKVKQPGRKGKAAGLLKRTGSSATSQTYRDGVPRTKPAPLVLTPLTPRPWDPLPAPMRQPSPPLLSSPSIPAWLRHLPAVLAPALPQPWCPVLTRFSVLFLVSPPASWPAWNACVFDGLCVPSPCAQPAASRTGA